MFYINFGSLMCQRKQQMIRCSAGSFRPPTGHDALIVAIVVVLRRWAFDRAAICRRRMHTRCIPAADGWLLASAVMVDCRLWLFVMSLAEACSAKTKRYL